MTPVLFSVSYAGYWGQHRLDLPAFLRKAAALGYPAVELAAKRPHLSPLDHNDESLMQLRRLADQLGVAIVTIAGYTDWTSGRDAAEVPFVEMQLAYVDSLARMGRLLGAKIVRVFSGYSRTHHTYQSDWNRCVVALREAATRVQQHGLILGLQNHHDLGVGTAAFEELLDEVDHPNLHAMFDPWAPALHGDDLYKVGRRLAPRMVQTTLADYVRLPRHVYRPELVNYERQEPDAIRAVPLGEGFLDLPAFFAGLRDGGFDRLVAYEMCSPVRGGGSEANLDRVASLSLARIRQLIGGS
ncbi:MAG: sugar phosphate isomerase/epimerase family protein [Gemmataceae bacterium]